MSKKNILTVIEDVNLDLGTIQPFEMAKIKIKTVLLNLRYIGTFFEVFNHSQKLISRKIVRGRNILKFRAHTY